jgi:hypothetical protein
MEQRMKALEGEIAEIRARLNDTGTPGVDWLDKIWGSFKDDPVYEEAMRLGREYREAQRPKPRRRRRRSG